MVRDQDFGKYVQDRSSTLLTFGVLGKFPNYRTILAARAYRPDLERVLHTHSFTIIRQNRFIKQAQWELLILHYYDLGAFHYSSENYIWKRSIAKKHQQLNKYIFDRLAIHLEHVHPNYFGLPSRLNKKFDKLGDVELDQMHFSINYYYATLINNWASDFIAGVNPKTVKGIILDG